MKHTKGEWIVKSQMSQPINGMLHFTADIQGTSENRYEPICYIQCCSHLKDSIHKEEAAADAKLIAAAPELLEALIMVKAWAEEYGMAAKYFNQVESAINKATL